MGELEGGSKRRDRPAILRPVLAIICFFFLIGWGLVSAFGSHRTRTRPRHPADPPRLTRTPAAPKTSTGVEGRWRHGTDDFVTVTASKDGSIIVDHKNTHAVFSHDETSDDYLEKSVETGNTTNFRTLHFDQDEDTLRVQTFKAQGSDYTEENYVRAD